MIKELTLPMEMHVMDRIGEESRCLSPRARIFDSEDERLLAERVLRQVGDRLVKNNPLGYGAGQLLVAFEDTVPNNTIPPLWCGRGEWRPLLRRPV